MYNEITVESGHNKNCKYLQCVAKFDIKVKVTTWIGHKAFKIVSSIGMWLFDKKLISYLVTCITTRNNTISLENREWLLKKMKMLMIGIKHVRKPK